MIRFSHKAENFSFGTDQTTGSLDLNNAGYSPSNVLGQISEATANQGVSSAEHLPDNIETGALALEELERWIGNLSLPLDRFPI